MEKHQVVKQLELSKIQEKCNLNFYLIISSLAFKGVCLIFIRTLINWRYVMDILAKIKSTAMESPDRLVFSSRAGQMTYGELWEKPSSLANYIEN